MKGQEFDVFKLLISVIVAGAILMILMGILNQIGGFGSDLKSVIKQQLNACGGSCTKLSKRIKLNVDKGYELSIKDFPDTPATSLNFIVKGFNEIKGGSTLKVKETVRNKNAILYVSCTNGKCDVTISQP